MNTIAPAGVIDGPLVVDAMAISSCAERIEMERGGPVRADDDAKSEHPATYTGSIKGNTMTLTLKVGDSLTERRLRWRRENKASC